MAPLLLYLFLNIFCGFWAKTRRTASRSNCNWNPNFYPKIESQTAQILLPLYIVLRRVPIFLCGNRQFSWLDCFSKWALPSRAACQLDGCPPRSLCHFPSRPGIPRSRLLKDLKNHRKGTKNSTLQLNRINSFHWPRQTKKPPTV